MASFCLHRDHAGQRVGSNLLQRQREMCGIMLNQQRKLAEVRGQLKALIQMQGAS